MTEASALLCLLPATVLVASALKEYSRSQIVERFLYMMLWCLSSFFFQLFLKIRVLLTTFTLLKVHLLFYNFESIVSSIITLFCVSCNWSISVIYRALVEDLLYLSQLSTLVVQRLMTQCTFGWRTWVLEVLKFASANSCLLTETIKTQLWYVKFSLMYSEALRAH